MDILQLFKGLSLNEIETIPYEARFTSQIAGSVTPGTITWDNESIKAHDALSSKLYFITSIDFNVNIDKNVFLNALDPTFNNGFIDMSIIPEKEKYPVNKSPIEFANYTNDRQIAIPYQSRRNTKQSIDFNLSGQIIQTNEVIAHLSEIGKTTLDAYISCVIYGINNQKWIDKYFLAGSIK